MITVVSNISEDTKKLNLVGVNEVSFRIDTSKDGELFHIKIRESEASFYEMYIDTDDVVNNVHVGESML